MSSLRNAINTRAHKERAQPSSRKKFGLLEKHKDYVIRAKAFHKKEETIRKLKEKAAFKNPDEFYFKMIKTKTIDGVHRPESEAKKYSHEELMLMKTQDMGYILQKIQSEKNKIEKLRSALHSLDSQRSNKHIYFADDREEAKEIKIRLQDEEKADSVNVIPNRIKRKTLSSYRELDSRQKRLEELEKVYAEMALQNELQAILSRVGYTPEINHGVLMQMDEHRRELEKKTKPILDTLRSYQNLPPTLYLARFMEFLDSEAAEQSVTKFFETL